MRLKGGIDPGLDGAIVVFEITETTQEIKNIIIFKIPLIGKIVDLNELSIFFREIQKKYTNIHFVIEDVHAIFGSSAKGTFTFGRVVGQLEGILSALMIPYTAVQPKTWQSEMFQGVPEIRKQGSKILRLNKESGAIETRIRKGNRDTKKMAEVATKRLFPTVNIIKPRSRKKKVDEGVVDALLICEYCKRKF
jgi:hypothetical protein